MVLEDALSRLLLTSGDAERAMKLLEPLRTAKVFQLANEMDRKPIYEHLVWAAKELGDTDGMEFYRRQIPDQTVSDASFQRRTLETEIVFQRLLIQQRERRTELEFRRMESELARLESQRERLNQEIGAVRLVSGRATVTSLALAIALAMLILLFAVNRSKQKAAAKLAEEQQVNAELQQKLARHRRMDSLGLMAGSVAHDFNNILVGISGNAELLQLAGQQGKLDDAFVVDRVQAIEVSSQRAQRLARQMLDYAGKQYLFREVTDLREPVANCRELCQAYDQAAHPIVIKCPDNPVLASVDRDQLDQAIYNLVTNAMNASLPGTEIRVGVGVKDVTDVTDDATYFGSRARGGRFAMIEVSDQGTGIPPARLDKIFEPYYTNSAEGRGLGLAVVYGTMESHDGLIRCLSSPDKGATFQLLFPLAEAEANTSQTDPRQPDDESVDAILLNRHVLVIDDEAMVLETCAQLLEQLGMRTVLADNGSAGLELLLESPWSDTIDCLLLDVVMPDMSAAETLKQLEQRGLDIPVVIMSGFSPERLDSYGRYPNVAAILPKPFHIAELKQALSRALDQSGESQPQSPIPARLRK